MNRPEVQNKGNGAANHDGVNRPRKQGTSHKGILSVIRLNKAAEAFERNAHTPHERRRKHREGRCCI